MDYEKKYKEALKMAKGIIRYYKEHNRSDEAAIEDLEGIFPELKESEDEKVRNALAEMVHDTTGDELWVDYNVHKEEALAWLEKQGEQKSQRMISAEAKEAMYDKPAWSEDDEKIITGIINDIQKRLEDCHLEQLAEIYFKEIDWLKSLKVRI